ncbi:MAG: ABC transporter ATP-binding protein [Paracoccus sp. (in: a-proteobacteria)]
MNILRQRVRGSRPEGMAQALPAFLHMLYRFRPYLTGSRLALSGGFIALLGATAMRLLEPWPLKFVIDRIVRPSATDTTSGDVSDPFSGLLNADPATLVAICAISLALVIGFRALLQFLATTLFSQTGSKALTGLRHDLFAHLQKLPPEFHDRIRPGDLTLRLVGDIGMLKDTATTAVMPLAANMLVLGGMVAVMCWLDWRLALLVLLPLPVLLLMTTRIGNRIRNASRVQRKRESGLADSAAEMLGAIRSVQALQLEEATGRIFRKANSKSQDDSVRSGRLGALMERSVDIMVGLATAAVLWFGTQAVLSGRLSPGDLLVFLTYLKNTFRPLRDYAKYSSRLAKASAAAERVFELLDTEPSIQDAPDARPAPGLRGQISFENVGFHYPDGRQVFDGLNLNVPEGQSIALTGPSGIGKSTLFWLLLRMRLPQTGRILIDGQDIAGLKLADIRRQIAFLPQEPVLFAGTIAENITLGAGREVSEDEMHDAVRMAGAEGFISVLPEGFNAPVNERGTNFSAGQRQRLALARAALRDAPILLLDEPTVGLDPASDARMQQAILRLASRRTLILITHDMQLAEMMDQCLWIGDGQVRRDMCGFTAPATNGIPHHSTDGMARYMTTDSQKEVPHAVHG